MCFVCFLSLPVTDAPCLRKQSTMYALMVTLGSIAAKPSNLKQQFSFILKVSSSVVLLTKNLTNKTKGKMHVLLKTPSICYQREKL